MLISYLVINPKQPQTIIRLFNATFMKKLLFILCCVSYWHVAAQNHYQHLIDSIAKSHQLVGMTYTVVHGEKELLAYAWGNRCLGEHQPITLSDRFHLGASSKTLTAWVAARLVEQGKIQWQTSFFSLFPDLQSTSRKVYQETTLETLLNHRAMLPAFTNLASLENLTFEGSVREQRAKFIAHILQQAPPIAPAGQDYVYSHAGYVMAAAMLEKVSDIPFEELAVQLINEELAIDINFGFPNQLSKQGVCGHQLKNGRLSAVSSKENVKIPAYLVPALDFNMNIQNYGKWLRHHLLGVHGKDSKFLPQSSYEKLLFGYKEYALGWNNNQKVENKLRIASSDGSIGTFFCHTVLYPDKNLGIAIFINSAEPSAMIAVQQIQKVLLKEFGR